MKKEKPLILLSNDDGVEAKGLNELIRGLRGMGEIIVMAPDGPRSGASGAITSEHPVKYYKVREEEDLTVYKCTGTPVDCVKLALHTVVPRRPDVVIGGINHGDNSSVNVHYSGTMGVVIEGCLKGISSIGYSLLHRQVPQGGHPQIRRGAYALRCAVIRGQRQEGHDRPDGKAAQRPQHRRGAHGFPRKLESERSDPHVRQFGHHHRTVPLRSGDSALHSQFPHVHRPPAQSRRRTDEGEALHRPQPA